MSFCPAKAFSTAANSCLNNLKETGVAYTMYRSDNNDVNWSAADVSGYSE